MDFFKEIEKATDQWRFAHNVEPQVKHSLACPGGVKEGIYTQEFKYHWGSSWVAMDEKQRFPQDIVGRGRTEQEAIEDLKGQL